MILCRCSSLSQHTYGGNNRLSGVLFLALLALRSIIIRPPAVLFRTCSQASGRALPLAARRSAVGGANLSEQLCGYFVP